MRLRARLLLLPLWCAALAAQAGDIYRWTDSKGEVHMGDKVPSQYRKKATKVNVRIVNRGFALPAASAAARQPAASAPLIIIGNDKPLADVTPKRQVTRTDSCEQQMQAYREAEACWAPYKMKGGKTSAEGYRQCKVVQRPDCP